MTDITNFSEQLITATQLARKTSLHLDNAQEYPIFIQRDQEVKWVLMSLEEYERLNKKKGK